MTSGTMEYQHVQQWQQDIFSEFSSLIDAQGNTDALAVLNDYQDPSKTDQMKTQDVDRWSCGLAVAQQIKLLSEMQKKGLIEQHSGQHSTTSSTTGRDSGGSKS